MTEWNFWGEKQIAGVYENIYVRTFVEDWFDIVLGVAKEIRGGEILDIGCGEGHTTKQILDRVKGKHSCDLVEPNKEALLSAKRFLQVENSLGEGFVDSLASFDSKKQYDVVFTSHTNYYWSKSESGFQEQLDKAVSLVKPGGKLLILTLPEKSDHYNIMLRQVYPEFNYAGYLIDYYQKKGLKVRLEKFRMRMFVGDLLTNENHYDLFNFYRFIHNTDRQPSLDEGKRFLEKVKKFQKGGYLDFRDVLIVVDV